MTEEEQRAAEAYLKLHENVREVVLSHVLQEVKNHPHSELASAIRWHIAMTLQEELKNFRVTRVGQTATQY